jgi:EcsC protein family
VVTTRSLPVSPAGLASEDLAALEHAWHALEQPSFAARASSIIGAPIEQVLRLFPRSWHDRVHGVAQTAIARAYHAAVASLEPSAPASGPVAPHRALAMATGAIGGFFGLPALLVELPATTILMLRAIADTARRHGEPLEDYDTRLACLEVFALGSRGTADDYAEIGYYEVRIGLAVHFAAATSLALGLESRAALPAPVGLIRALASRFGVVVSDKAAAQMVPVLGAIAGGLVNAAFMDHFQKVAEGHFTVRRLERRYGSDLVESAYHAIGDMIAGRGPITRTAGRRRSRRAGSAHPG